MIRWLRQPFPTKAGILHLLKVTPGPTLIGAKKSTIPRAILHTTSIRATWKWIIVSLTLLERSRRRTSLIGMPCHIWT